MTQITEHISSIETAWPPVSSSHNRLRGFYTSDVIASRQSAETLESQIGDALEIAQADDLDRVTIKVVAELGALARLTFNSTPTSVEAVLPIAGTDLGVVYLGANQPQRHMNAEHLAAHERLLCSVREGEPGPDPETLLAARSLQAAIVNPADAAGLADAFAPRYAVFGYDRADTEALLGDDANTVAYVESDGVVISTAMAERATVKIGGYGDLGTVEITEASTHPEFRRQGLYAAISGFLVRQLIETCGETDVIYGESNLAAPGVVYAAHQNGRRFSFFDRAQLGVDNPAFGILPQNVTVRDGVEQRRYNDFAVSYVPLPKGERYAG